MGEGLLIPVEDVLEFEPVDDECCIGAAVGREWAAVV